MTLSEKNNGLQTMQIFVSAQCTGIVQSLAGWHAMREAKQSPGIGAQPRA